MSLTTKIMLVLFGLAYLISPMDLIPDLLLPFVGWIDDSLILWSIYYLIRYGELPWFAFKKKAAKRFPGRSTGPDPRSRSNQATGNNKTNNNQTKNNQAENNKTRKKTGRSPHDILGVDETASWTEIKAAYREKIKKYHPDRLSHLGKEFTDLANEKFLEIQAAYGKLKEKKRP